MNNRFRKRRVRYPAARGPHAVVVGLGTYVGLQTARILSARGVPVIGVTATRDHRYSRTRVCEQILETDLTPGSFAESMKVIGSRLEDKAVLYPCTDRYVLLVAQNLELLRQWYHVMQPEPKTIEMLVDKTKFAAYAVAHGLLIPATVVVRENNDAERAARRLNFPCVVKPAIKTSTWTDYVGAKVVRVSTSEAWLAFYAHARQLVDTLVVQEWIEGKVSDYYSCNCYFNAAGQPAVTFVSRKIRKWRHESCFAEEVRNDVVLSETLRLFSDLNFRGLGYLEMKQDARTGRYLIIESNVGRPTGGSAIAEAGGVELLYSQYCDALGWPPPPGKQSYRGVKWIYGRRDLQAAWNSWRSGELSLREWARSLRGVNVDAMFSRQDPMPFLWELYWCVTELVKRRSGVKRSPGSQS